MTKNLFTGVAVLTSVGLLASFATFSRAQRQRAREAQAYAAEQRALHANEAANADLSATKTKIHAIDSALELENAKSNMAKTPPANIPDSWFKKSEQDPTLQNLKFAANRGQQLSRYRPFLNSLHLPTEKVDSFLQLRAQYNQQRNDIFASSDAEGIPGSDSSVQALLDLTEKNYIASLRQLLGDSGYSDFQVYQRTANVRDLVSGISANAAMAGTPYTQEQAERLVAVLANASPAYTRGQAADLYNIDWDKADLGARAVLAPDQYNSYLSLEPNGTEYGGGRAISQLNKTIRDALALDKKESPSNSVP